MSTWPDIRVASDCSSTKIAFVHKHMALTPSWHGGILLKNHVGQTSALKMLMTGNVYKAGDLVDCGYISEITEKDVMNFEWQK